MRLAGTFLFFLVLVLTLGGCRSTPPEIPTSAPSISGTITESESHGRNSGLILVEEKPIAKGGSRKVRISITEQTRVFRRIGPLRVTADNLSNGQRVSAWFVGSVTESDPVQALASTVMIDEEATSASGESSPPDRGEMASGEAARGGTASRPPPRGDKGLPENTHDEKGTQTEESAGTDAGPPPGDDSVAAEPSDSGGTAGTGDRPRAVPGVAVLTSVREGSHSGYDRVVFEFAGDELPVYHVEYIDRPVRECGSGAVASVAGDAWLEVRFEPAQAHTDAGQPTVPARDRRPGFPNIQQIRMTCDFEAQVTWVLGVASPNKYQIAELSRPPRLVIDIPN